MRTKFLPRKSRSEMSPPVVLARVKSGAGSPTSSASTNRGPTAPETAARAMASTIPPNMHVLMLMLLAAFLDELGQLARASRVERAQLVEHAPGVLDPAHLHIGLAKVFERLGEVRAKPQRFMVGVDGFTVAALIAQGKAQFVPGVGERRAEAQRGAEGRLGHRPVLHDPRPDAAVVLALRVGHREGLTSLLHGRRAGTGEAR